jgi:hypothetical protein
LSGGGGNQGQRLPACLRSLLSQQKIKPLAVDAANQTIAAGTNKRHLTRFDGHESVSRLVRLRVLDISWRVKKCQKSNQITRGNDFF